VSVAELAGLLGLTMLYVVMSDAALPSSTMEVVSAIGAGLFTVTLAVAAWRASSSHPFAMLTPLFWFRVASLVYFGFGTLIAQLGSAELQAYIQAFYRCDEDMLLKIGLLNALGATAALGAARLTDDLRPVRTSTMYGASARYGIRRGGNRCAVLEHRYAIAFGSAALIVGGLARVFVDLPNQFGLFDMVLPGVLGVLRYLQLVGFAILLAMRWAYNPNMFSLVIVLWCADLGLGLLTFAKTDVLLTALAGVFALLLAGVSRRTILLALGGVALLYATVRPIVDHGREEMYRRYGALTGAGFAERVEYVRDFFERGALGGSPESSNGDADWGWLARFSYVNAQGFVVDRFDRGDPSASGSLAYLATMLVPRVLWPEKPNVSEVGTQLYTLATGQTGTSVAPGVFAEAYWNGGWGFVVLWGGYVGIVLAVFGRLAIRSLERGEVMMLPVIVGSIFLGCRPDGWFGMTYVGGAATLAVTAIALQGFVRVVRMRAGGSRLALGDVSNRWVASRAEPYER
jgi:hypothetical protein